MEAKDGRKLQFNLIETYFHSNLWIVGFNKIFRIQIMVHPINYINGDSSLKLQKCSFPSAFILLSEPYILGELRDNTKFAG